MALGPSIYGEKRAKTVPRHGYMPVSVPVPRAVLMLSLKRRSYLERLQALDLNYHGQAIGDPDRGITAAGDAPW